MSWRAAVLAVLLLVSPAALAVDNPYLAELIAQAHARKLADRPEWRNLLHYKPYPYWFGVRSLADDPAFFNAPDGKTNPQAELDATLAAFFSDRVETDKQQNPQCQFIARYGWLKSELGFDPQRLPQHECKRYEEWRATLNPQDVTLVFPSAYINSPASMYGHTLLRIDARDQDERTRLLAYSISYAAGTNETSGLIFAAKGLFGGYPGVFSVTPYYMKVREYSDLENRDVWEYRLNLTPDEMDKVIKHVWELQPTHFDYYFLDENCSYHLLAVLDVARPGLNTTDQFRWWAIPSDTVRAVVEIPGMLREVVYRPASSTLIRYRAGLLTDAQRKLAQALAAGKLALDAAELKALPPAVQASVLELAFEYANYRRIGGDKKVTEGQLRDLLVARSRIDLPSSVPPPPMPQTRPDQGHKTARVGLGGGVRDGDSYGEFRMRTAYHDLLDDDRGYTRGAQLQFADLAVRKYASEDELRLERFLPIDIMSITPRDDFFRPMSWKVNVGWARKRMSDGREPLVARLNFGYGMAWDLGMGGVPVIGYGLMEAAIEGSRDFDNGYALGAGPTLGLLADFGWRSRLAVEARSLRFGIGDVHDQRELRVVQRVSTGAQSALMLDLGRSEQGGRYWNSAGLTWFAYF